MKKCYLYLLSVLAISSTAVAQSALAPDQNPNYAVSRDKYVHISDSVNKMHSTTLQNTYEAIDWREDRIKERNDRREFRQQLRLERARWSGDDYRNDNGYYNSYNHRNNSYYSPYNNNYNYRARRWWW